MNSRLDRVESWEILATRCGYCLDRMARECGMSRQHLRRYFLEQFHLNPKDWLDDLRWHEAAARLADGELAKAVSSELSFKQQSHFSKFFKRMAHQTPTEYQAKCSR